MSWRSPKFELFSFDRPLVTESGLSIGEVLGGGDDITVKSWGEVVVGVLGFVLPLVAQAAGTDLELMTDHVLGEFDTFEIIIDVFISSEVWHEVVDVITKILLFVLVLSATSR